MQVYMCNTVIVAQIKNKLVCWYCQTWSHGNFGLIFIFYWPPAEPLPDANGSLWFSRTQVEKH